MAKKHNEAELMGRSSRRQDKDKAMKQNGNQTACK